MNYRAGLLARYPGPTAGLYYYVVSEHLEGQELACVWLVTEAAFLASTQ